MLRPVKHLASWLFPAGARSRICTVRKWTKVSYSASETVNPGGLDTPGLDVVTRTVALGTNEALTSTWHAEVAGPKLPQSKVR